MTPFSPHQSELEKVKARNALLCDIEFIVDEWRENGEVNAEGALSRIASAIDDATLAEMKARNATGSAA